MGMAKMTWFGNLAIGTRFKNRSRDRATWRKISQTRASYSRSATSNQKSFSPISIVYVSPLADVTDLITSNTTIAEARTLLGMGKALSPDELDKLTRTLEGTCDSIDAALERIGFEPHDYDVSEVEDAVVGTGIEMCPGCGWWMECGELTDDDNEIVGCRDCRPKTEDAHE